MSISLRVVLLLLSMLSLCGRADDIDIFRGEAFRAGWRTQLSLHLPGLPGAGIEVCTALSDEHCRQRLGTDLLRELELLQQDPGEPLYHPQLLRAALLVAVERLRDNLELQLPSPQLDIVLQGTEGVPLLEAIQGIPEWPHAGPQHRPPLAPANQQLDECGRSWRVNLLAGPMGEPPDRWRAPEQLLPTLLRQLHGTLADSASLVMPRWMSFSPTQQAGDGELLLAMFQPAADRDWYGNVKKLGLRSGRLVDARGDLIEAAPGEVLPATALTLWTDVDDPLLQGLGPPGSVAGRDGGFTTRGGAGSRLPYVREVYTEHPGNPGQLLALSAPQAARELAPHLDPADTLSPEERQALLAWIVGADSYDEDGDGDRQERRRWLMGSVIHSRPLAVNFGARPGSAYSALNPDVRILFGGNDGLFRMLENTTDRGLQSGRETFAFLPLALLPLQWRLARQASGESEGLLYGVDGEPVSLRLDLDGDGTVEPADGDSAWVYVGLRRGGASYYAFDISHPEQPRLGWKVDAASPGFEQLGLSFATPQPMKVNWGDGSRWVLLFGGGYHGGWTGGLRVGKDAGRGEDPVGNAVYLVDAFSGELLWRARGPSEHDGGEFSPELSVQDLRHGIAAEFTALDLDGDEHADIAYVGDTGGNLWRLELHGGDPAAWQLLRLAELGGEGAADRRFFHAPDVVAFEDQSGSFLGLLLASGNRAAPLDYIAENGLYLIKDRLSSQGRPEPEPTLRRHASFPLAGAECEPDGTSNCGDPQAGWYLGFKSVGEKGLGTPITAGGIVSFSSFVPPDPADPCAPASGSSRLYLVEFENGSFAASERHRINLPGLGEDASLDLGPGMVAGIVPTSGRWLLPLPVGGEESAIAVPGESLRRLAWREFGVDEM